MSTSQSRVKPFPGDKGHRLLKEVNQFVRKTAHHEGWPLDGVAVRIESDPEFENSEYAMVVLKLRCSQGSADETLDNLHPHLERLMGSLEADERELFLSRVFFDVETT